MHLQIESLLEIFPMSSDNPFGNDQTDVEESNPFSSSVSREEGIDISDAKEEFSGDKGKLEQDESPTQDSAGKSGDGTNVFGEISQGWTAQWDEATKMIEISHPKLNILVSAPEVVSSVMSK